MIVSATRLALALGVVCAAAIPHTKAENNYPEKPIRLVIGFAAGGATDIPARFIAEQLSQRLNKPVVVENKPGAGAMLATRDVLSHPADGYTLLFCSHYDATNTVSYNKPGYSLDDLDPISLTSRYYFGISVTNHLPVKDWGEFVSYAKANPGKVSYATLGAGSAQEVFALQLEELLGIKMTGVPYRGGAHVTQDLLPGRVHMFISAMSQSLPMAADKKLKVVAISSAERSPAAPDIPTLKEKGLDFIRFGILGVCARKGTPQPIIDRLNKELRAIVDEPKYRKLIESAAAVPESSTPEEFGKLLHQTRADVEPTIDKYNLRRD